MGIFNLFTNSRSKKGEDVADFIISLGSNEPFRQLLTSTPKPMSYRLVIDHILVCSSAATYALAFNTREKPDQMKSVYKGMMDRLVFHLKGMSESGVHFNVKDIIVDEEEKNIFVRDGWKLQEKTDIYTLFDVIGDYRMEKYTRAVGEGIMEAMQQGDGMLMTAKLMRETKKNCGDKDFPYVELKLIYSDCIARIVQLCAQQMVS